MNRYAVRLLWAMGVLVILTGCALWILGCGSSPKALTAADTEAACLRAVEALGHDRDSGMSCPAAKAHVAILEPECHLVFTCKEEKK